MIIVLSQAQLRADWCSTFVTRGDIDSTRKWQASFPDLAIQLANTLYTIQATNLREGLGMKQFKEKIT